MIHVVIPDTQVKPGVRTDHLRWIGQYIVDHFAEQYPSSEVKIIHLGDHWDFPSLSSYDKGKKAMEGRRYIEDLKAGNDGFLVLNKPLIDFNKKQSKKNKKQWWPDRRYLLGNHCHRVIVAVENDAKLDGTLSIDSLNAKELGWKVHGFLEPIDIDGIVYSHYFYTPNTGKAYSGAALRILDKIGRSYIQGHRQGLDVANKSIIGKRIRGIIAGSCYLHNEDYRGPQAFDEWRGILICHNVNEGNYDLMEVSLDYLCRRYEGISLNEFLCQQ